MPRQRIRSLADERYPPAFAAALRSALAYRRISMRALGNILGVGERTVGRWCRGEVLPQLQYLPPLLEALRMDPALLVFPLDTVAEAVEEHALATVAAVRRTHKEVARLALSGIGLPPPPPLATKHLDADARVRARARAARGAAVPDLRPPETVRQDTR